MHSVLQRIDASEHCSRAAVLMLAVDCNASADGVHAPDDLAEDLCGHSGSVPQDRLIVE